MNVKFYQVKRGAALALCGGEEKPLAVVYGEGAGSTIMISGGAAAIWVPLCESLRVETAVLDFTARKGEVLVTEYEPHLKAVGRRRAKWIALVGGKSMWRQLLGQRSGTLVSDTQLIPACHGADRKLRKFAVAAARSASALELESSVHAFIDKFAELQAPLHVAIARCPGRTLAKRRHVFLRLQRVRNFISANCDVDLGNNDFARMANFSPCHFLRIYNRVFRETPHAHLVTERLHRARRLLRSSDLAIAEIAVASGFENRCSFSRSFHQRFGATAIEMRRQSANQ